MPLQGQEEIAFLHRHSLTDGTLDIHSFPFRTLPLLRSHLHPNFTIVDAGKKLVDGPYTQAITGRPDLVSELDSIMIVYYAWTEVLSKEEQRGPSFANPDNPDNSDDDDGGDKYFDDSNGEDDDNDGSGSRKPKAPSTRSAVLRQRHSILGPNQKGPTQVGLSGLEKNHWMADCICEWNHITQSRQRVLLAEVRPAAAKPAPEANGLAGSEQGASHVPGSMIRVPVAKRTQPAKT